MAHAGLREGARGRRRPVRPLRLRVPGLHADEGRGPAVRRAVREPGVREDLHRVRVGRSDGEDDRGERVRGMSDLTEFLSARIAEDEAVAREATPGPWWNESGTVHAPYPFGRDLAAGNGGACHPLDAQGGNGRDAEADAEHASR